MRYSIGWSPRNDIVITGVDIFEKHCAIEMDEFKGSFKVINLNKHSKTYINDLEVQEGLLKEGDKLRMNDCTVDYSWIERQVETIEKQKERIRSEFFELRQLFDEYQASIDRIHRKYQGKETLIRIGFGAMPIIFSILFRKELGHMAYVVGCLSSIFVVSVNYFLDSSTRRRNEINALKLNFLLRYRCPSCNERFGDIDWNLLADQKECPNCKCQLCE